ncbi:hypothetical protein [Hymenobacter psoromatis]|nr:hypothetical protein [Hymenobacter psoromatis]
MNKLNELNKLRCPRLPGQRPYPNAGEDAFGVYKGCSRKFGTAAVSTP